MWNQIEGLLDGMLREAGHFVDTWRDQRWVTSQVAAKFLGYENKGGLLQLAERMRKTGELLAPQHTRTVFYPTKGGYQPTIVFTLRGIFLLAMHSRTPQAKDVRDLVDKIPMDKNQSHLSKNAQKHWTEELSPAERLRLVRLRLQIGDKVLADPTNPLYIGLMEETYGGKAGFQEWCRLKGLNGANWLEAAASISGVR